MCIQYRYLGLTTRLLSLKELRHLYNYSRSRAEVEVEVILNYMKNNGMFDNLEYKEYFSFSQVLKEDLYGKEEDILNDGILIDCNCIVLEEFN
ncbi:hypothetical protein [Bacillus toyonensis]|uniref:hypothetical protein n=1 Tax=Bacillus toyonensis TaxID=155322 RepID=UPI003D64E8EA